MSSKALIMKSELSHSGDKGVSVGEGSEAMIYNSSLNHNMIGVESKDGSVAYVVNSSLIKNDRQINAYKKNWRYGTGGRVVIDKSIFSSLDNSIKADKKSDIKIFDSTFSTGLIQVTERLYRQIISLLFLKSCRIGVSKETLNEEVFLNDTECRKPFPKDRGFHPL